MELHDNVNQILSASVLFVDMAKSKITDKEVIAKILSDLKKYSLDAITEIRRISHQLAPLVDEDTILEDKIQWLIKSIKFNDKLSISVNIEKFNEPLENNIQLAFFRILQEQLNNIRKYANATKVAIDIAATNGMVALKVIDNGVGFDTKVKKQGIGLENIRRRTQMLNGKVEIFSNPGEGCKLYIEIPVYN